MNSRILLFLLLLCTAGYGQSFDKTKLDQFLDKLDENKKAMGSLTIVKDGHVIYQRAIGYQQIDETKTKPLSIASRFSIASISKMFTAAMILQLVEEGKLNLNDKLDKFFPTIPNAGKITLLHILGHRSGIPNVRRSDNISNKSPITKDEMHELIVKATPDFEPNTKHLYSNSGYFILGLILEKVTATSYENLLQTRICSKAKLTDTYTATGNIDVQKSEALTYMRFGNEWKPIPETHPSILFGAGQIISTPNDLAKFAKALFDGKIVSKQHLQQMTTIKDGDGLGMEEFSYADKTFYGHTGGGDNYGSWLAYMPEEKLSITYCTNAKVYPVADIIKGVANIYYNKPFEIPDFKTIMVSDEMLDKYVGVYSAPDVPVKFTITKKDGLLYVQPGQQTAAPLEAIAENKFQLTNGAVMFDFDIEKKEMIQKRGDQRRVFTKDK